MSENQERKMCKCGKSNEKPYCDGSHKVKQVDFSSKSQKRRIVKELGQDMEKAEISDEDFQVFLDAIFDGYKGGGYNPE